MELTTGIVRSPTRVTYLRTEKKGSQNPHQTKKYNQFCPQKGKSKIGFDTNSTKKERASFEEIEYCL